jgi:hypothetical protein
MCVIAHVSSIPASEVLAACLPACLHIYMYTCIMVFMLSITETLF